MNRDDEVYSSVKFPMPVRKGLGEVRKRLSEFRASDFVNPDLFNPSVHLLRKNGKMMRPALVLLVANALGRHPSDYVDLAIAAELIHTSSLIHDDIIDDDLKRRGTMTVHRKYGSGTALLAGDALIAKSISMASKYGGEVLNSIARSSLEMCAGELLDYNMQREGSVPDLDQYINIARLKSASLIASCSNAVALHIGSRYADSLYMFGNDLGIAFQIRDDIIDYMGWARQSRKGTLLPNVVSSIESEYRIGRYPALMKAYELNRKYVNNAIGNLDGKPEVKLLRDYSSLIRLHT